MDPRLREPISGQWQWSAGIRGQSERRNSGDIVMTDIDVARPTSTSRRLSQKQATRRVSSMSDSVDITDTGAQFEGRALLEEWPWRDSFMDTSMCYKEVAFSDYSSLHLYPTHEVERRKSYTSAEIKEFKNQVSADALRVQELIAEIPLERGPAVRHLISQNKLTPEELVGIDHLICDDNAARKIAFERYTHSTIVLQKQYKVMMLSWLPLPSRGVLKARRKQWSVQGWLGLRRRSMIQPQRMLHFHVLIPLGV